MWLVGVGGIYGCGYQEVGVGGIYGYGCKEVYNLILLIPTPLVYICSFLQQHPFFVHF